MTRRTGLTVTILLAAHSVLALHGAATDFITFDEAGHLAGGLASVTTGTYRLYAVNPPLTKLFAALPVHSAGPDETMIVVPNQPAHRIELIVGERFAVANAASLRRLFVLGRLAGIAWSVVGGLLVFAWARRLFGEAGGVTALAAWCIEPNVIAYAHLIAADLPAAVAACAAAVAFGRYLRSPDAWTAFVAGVAFGVAQLCKFTLGVLAPAWLVIVVVAGNSPGWRHRLGHLTLLFGVAVFVVNIGYECQGSFRPLGDFGFCSRALAGETPGSDGNRFRDSWLANMPVPLPEDYLRGIDVQRRDFDQARDSRYNFLRGDWKLGGWWYYYLYAVAVKVPLGLWGLAVVALLARGTPRVGRIDRLLLALPPLAILALVSSQTSINSHLRYVLPVFPFAAVLLGRAGAWAAAGRRWRAGLVVALLAATAGSVLRVHPCELSYFNEAAGGPLGGPDHLLGSNVDWGQDLWRLKNWLDDHPEARPLRLGYFGHIDPRIVGIEFALPPLGPAAGLPAEDAGLAQLGPLPGWYAVSVRLSRGQRAAIPDGNGGYASVPFRGYDYFGHFVPVARAGYSILIYHITPADADAIRAEMGLPPLAGPPPAPPAKDDDPP